MQLSYRGVIYTAPERKGTVEDSDTARYRGAFYRVKKAVGLAQGHVQGLTYRGAQVR